jgi:hypothetical protein
VDFVEGASFPSLVLFSVGDALAVRIKTEIIIGIGAGNFSLQSYSGALNFT